MLKALKEIVRNLTVAPDAATGRHSVELAVVALLLEIGRADHSIAQEELASVVQSAAAVFGITEAESNALIDVAGPAVEASVSMFEFTEVLNRELDPARKKEILRALWRVAQADGRIDHYEEYYLRKVADLLHLSHRDFISAKLAVLEGR
jgi:uncharacterized tellurite resistance protein B-like protein